MKIANIFLEKRIALVSKIGIGFILFSGILLRFVYWFQNRNLFIDEANVVRNVYERNFLELLNPLAYEQYAPPVFLWVQETISLLLGYDEKVMRLFPLVCGVASLFVFYKLLQEFVVIKILWYVLAIFSFSMIFIYYSAMVKQYVPDALVSMLLLLSAKKINIEIEHKITFFIKWLLIGSVALWSSMSAVFILAGVGSFYFLKIIEQKKWSHIGPLVSVVLIWVTQFLIYYFLILSKQIGSEYLQNFHEPYFLHATLLWSDWQHNFSILANLLDKIGGHTFVAFSFHLLTFLVGIIFVYRKNKIDLALLLLPVLSVIFAAFLNQYTLIPRTNIFMFPLVLILMGLGLEFLIGKRSLYFLLPLLAIAIVNVINLKSLPLLWKFHGEEEITACFDFLKNNRKDSQKVYVAHLAEPSYVYYTQIHSDANEYNFIRDAHVLNWDTNFEQLGTKLSDTTYFVFTGGPQHVTSNEASNALEKNMKLFRSFHSYRSHVFGFAPQ